MKPTGAYRAYILGGERDGEEIGRYDSMASAYLFNKNVPITVIYRPSKKKTKREFPYNG